MSAATAGTAATGTDVVPLPTTDEVGDLLYARILEELNDGEDFSWADVSPLINLGTEFLRDFTHVPDDKKHEILRNTILKLSEDVKMSDTARAILGGLFATGLGDGIIKGAVHVYNLIKAKIMDTFDLNEDGKISAEEVGKVICKSCAPCGKAQFTEKELDAV